MSPIGGTFTPTLGAANCTLPHDATEEEIAEAVKEMNEMRSHMISMEAKFPGLEMSVDLKGERL